MTNEASMPGKPHLVVLSGAGMSAESGLRTFRDNDGLWENHRVEDVATPEAWRRNRALVLRFYNERRKALLETQPNFSWTARAISIRRAGSLPYERQTLLTAVERVLLMLFP